MLASGARVTPDPPRTRPESSLASRLASRLAAPEDNEGPPTVGLEESPVTRVLLALNGCVFGAQLFAGGGVTTPAMHELLAMGANYWPSTLGELRLETLVTACFLHGGWLHLAFNMIVLWQAGPLAERAMGSARMAPTYLAAGIFGNLLSGSYGWFTGTDVPTIGASGAISGLTAAALVIAWRDEGWRGPLTQAMARWLGFVVLFGVVSNLTGGNPDNAAHLGGAFAGAGIAAFWKTGYRYSPRATVGVLAGCGALLVACVAAVIVRDRTDRFAAMSVQERGDYTHEALYEGRCGDAELGLRAVDRVGARLGAAEALREQVDSACGHLPK